jgi:hypothetical protein
MLEVASTSNGLKSYAPNINTNLMKKATLLQQNCNYYSLFVQTKVFSLDYKIVNVAAILNHLA